MVHPAVRKKAQNFGSKFGGRLKRNFVSNALGEASKDPEREKARLRANRGAGARRRARTARDVRNFFEDPVAGVAQGAVKVGTTALKAADTIEEEVVGDALKAVDGVSSIATKTIAGVAKPLSLPLMVAAAGAVAVGGYYVVNRGT